jgi:eukaryotic-like serine/threonine-protein kinase
MERPKDFQPGEMVPGTVYRVVRMIGAGGMGTVYDVEDTTVGKRYVLKTLHPELYSRKDLAKRMQAEARTLARLSHPNIVEVVTAGATNDDLRLPFYVMEKLNGQNLRTILSKKGSLDLPHALHIGIDLLDALDNAHDKGVIHRDVKPDNIFLHRNSNGVTTTKLLDFGIMRLLDAGPGVTAGRFMGTLRYAAPEQLRGETLSAQTDLYAAGLVVYEMIAGQGPFDDLKDPNKVAAAHINTVPPPLLQFGAVVPESLERLLRGALSKDPAKRPKDAFTFGSQLRNLKRTLAMEKPAESPNSRPTEVPVVTMEPGSLGEPSGSSPAAFASTEHASTRVDPAARMQAPPAAEPLGQTTVAISGGMTDAPSTAGPTLVVSPMVSVNGGEPGGRPVVGMATEAAAGHVGHVDRGAPTHSAVPPQPIGVAGPNRPGATEPMAVLSPSAVAAGWRAPPTLRMSSSPPLENADDPSSQLLALLPIQESDGASSNVTASNTLSPAPGRVRPWAAVAVGLGSTLAMVGIFGAIAYGVGHRHAAADTPEVPAPAAEPVGSAQSPAVTAPAAPAVPSPAVPSPPVPVADQAPIPAPTLPPPLDVPAPSAPVAPPLPRAHRAPSTAPVSPPASPPVSPPVSPPAPTNSPGAKRRLPSSGL